MSLYCSCWNVGLRIDRALERDLRRVQRERGGHQRQHVGVVLLVRGDDVDEDLDLVLEAFGEQRPDRAVDDACRHDLVVVRTPLALDEAARDLPGGVRLLAVLDREREERQRALALAHRDRGEYHGVAVLDEGRTGRLLRHAPGLDDQLASGERTLHALHHCLVALSL